VQWTLAAVFLFATPGYRSIAGPLKGGDFIQYYVFGVAARAGDASRLYDYEYLHALQTSLLPESAPERYLPVYPPQAFLVYLPLAALSYTQALVLWTLLIVAIYAWAVWTCWHASRDALPDGVFVALAAAAFPPFWNLVLHGHNTIVPLAAFVLGWLAIVRQRRFLAGLALGALLFKPQFGLVLAAIVIACGEWAMLAGIAVAGAVQLALVWMLLDVMSIVDYVRFMVRVSDVEYLIEPKPWDLHSLRALTRFVPGGFGTALWLAVSAVVIERTYRVWRHATDPGVQMGTLVLATVLVSPHLFAYDATVLALTILWLGAWLQRDPPSGALATRYWPIVCGLFATFLVPTARVMFVQVSVLLMMWLLLLVAKEVTSAATSATQPAR
jgi:glycosyl transferase family 87